MANVITSTHVRTDKQRAHERVNALPAALSAVSAQEFLCTFSLISDQFEISLGFQSAKCQLTKPLGNEARNYKLNSQVQNLGEIVLCDQHEGDLCMELGTDQSVADKQKTSKSQPKSSEPRKINESI